MITYPSYFDKEIKPWIEKASSVLGENGVLALCHCDGENLGLMNSIRDSGMHIAEAICPAPMTKVKIEEYYRQWSDKLTIFGGIPSNMLLAESATEEEFEAYLDHLFQVIAPGSRMILGIADTTPPNAIFDRLIRIGERVEKEGRLPLEGGAARPVSDEQMKAAAQRVSAEPALDESLGVIQEDVTRGRHLEIVTHVEEFLAKGVSAEDILNRGMISAMEVIGVKFKQGDLFIPEVLLSARAMNAALPVLEPYLAAGKGGAGGKVLIATVRGDLHDIGKNMVVSMLRGVGFEIKDLGINVPSETIVKQVEEYQPDILGLSALLTTTMPEMKSIIASLEAKGLRPKLKIMVGGAPVNAKFAKDIGADAYAQDAGDAAAIAKNLMKA